MMHDLSEAFGTIFGNLKYQPRKPEPLNAICFPQEFNRCMEHTDINEQLRRSDSLTNESWYTVSPVVRTKDFGNVHSGRYCTAFEALCALSYSDASQSKNVLFETSRQCLDFIESVAGLKRERLAFSLFGGGEFLDQTFKRDDVWYEVWRRLGISDDQISWVSGPKLFMLFLGERERCGPRCEISYQPNDSISLEIGTLIWDNALISSNPKPSFESCNKHAIGLSIGLERLIAASTGRGVFDFEPFTSLMDELTSSVPSGGNELIGDCRALLDSLKAALFLDALTVDSLNTAQLDFVDQVHKRAVRKGFMLGLEGGLKWHQHALERMADSYSSRYVNITQSAVSVREKLEQIALAEAWNPSGYNSMVGSKGTR